MTHDKAVRIQQQNRELLRQLYEVKTERDQAEFNNDYYREAFTFLLNDKRFPAIHHDLKKHMKKFEQGKRENQ